MREQLRAHADVAAEQTAATPAAPMPQPIPDPDDEGPLEAELVD
jgi:hypothetical protein